METGRGRDMVKAARWRGHVERQGRSGQSVRGYCAAHGLSESGFYWWKRTIAERDAGGRGPGDGAGPRFAEVQVDWAGAAVASSGVELGLGGGVAIRLAVGFDEGTLRRALSVMAGRGAGC